MMFYEVTDVWKCHRPGGEQLLAVIMHMKQQVLYVPLLARTVSAALNG